MINYIGKLLNNEYLLIHKIGKGSFAIVWLAYKITNKQFYAIKMQNIEDYDEACDELLLLKEIKKKNNSFLNTFIESFDYKTPEGKHKCIVLELLGGSTFELIRKGKYKKGLPIKVVKEMTRQVLKGLITLHNELGIIHADIKPENLLIFGINKTVKEFIDMFKENDYDEIYNKYVKEYQIINKPKNMKFLQNKEIVNQIIKKTCDEIIYNIYDEDKHPMIAELDYNPFKKQSSRSVEHYLNSESSSVKHNNRNQSISDNTDESSFYSSESEIVNEKSDTESDTYSEHSNVSEKDIEVIKSESEITESNETYCILDDFYIDNCLIRVSDFGNSFHINEKPDMEIQTRYYRAPEIILALKYNEKCDIWSLGCTIFELLTGDILFDPDHNRTFNRDKQHIYWMYQVLGKIPQHILKKSKRYKYLFDDNGNIKGVNWKIDNLPIKDTLINDYNFSVKDANEIHNFLLKLLDYDHTKRLSAKEILKEDWLK